MGLAASQARLLFITSRQNDVSAKMQRISNQTMILARDEEEISDKYNRMLNEKVYKLKDTDLSYNTLMGSAAINSGYMNIITNDKGAVVLSDKDASRYGITSNTGGKGDFAAIHGSVDEFITHVEGSNAANIIAVKPTTSSDGDNVDGTGLTKNLQTKCDNFVKEWGTYPHENESSLGDILNKMGNLDNVQTSSMDTNDSLDGSDETSSADEKMDFSKLSNLDFSDIYEGLTSSSAADSHKRGNTGVNGHWVAIACDGDTSGTPKKQARNNFEWIAKAVKEKILEAFGFDQKLSSAAKVLDDYIKKIAESIGTNFSSDYTHHWATSTGGSTDNDRMSLDLNKLLKDMINKVLTTINASTDVNQNTPISYRVNEKGIDLPKWEAELKKDVGATDFDKALEYLTADEPVEDSSDDPATDGEKYACYEKLYNSLNSKGWAIEDVSSIMSKLENIESGYSLDGKPISTHEDLYVEDTGAATAKAEAYWKTETAKLSRKEKQLDRELTKLQTEYSSLTTDYESVKSIIQQNVTKSFTYCTSG